MFVAHIGIGTLLMLPFIAPMLAIIGWVFKLVVYWFELKGNSSLSTQNSVIFAIIEVKPYYWVGPKVTTLGHVGVLDQTSFNISSLKDKNYLVLKVKK